MSSGAAELTRAVEAVAVARACVEALRRGVTQGKIACPLPTEEALPALVGAGLALGVDDVVYGTERDWPVALGEEGGVQAVVSSIVNPSSDGSERFGTRIGRFVMMETGTAAYVAAAVGRGIAAARGTGRGVVICLIGAGTMALPEWGAAWQVAVAEEQHPVRLVDDEQASSATTDPRPGRRGGHAGRGLGHIGNLPGIPMSNIAG